MSAQVAHDLRAAAEVLRRDGWTQGRLHERMSVASCEGAHCARGAIHVATGVVAAYADESKADEAYQRANIAESALLSELGSASLVIWNDSRLRTADEVIAALEAAADAAEADQ